MDGKELVEQRAAGIKKLLAITSELVVEKNRSNNFGKFKYRSAEDILAALKPLCTKYSAVLTISDSVVMVGDRYYVRAKVDLIDADNDMPITTSSAFAREQDEKKGMDAAQVTGAASSYARKYALAGMFNLSPSDDDKGVVEPDADEIDHKLIGQVVDLCTQAGINQGDFFAKLWPTGYNNGMLKYAIDHWTDATEEYMRRLNAHA